MVKVTVNSPTRFHRPAIIKFLEENGITEVRKPSVRQVTFLAEFELATKLMADMKHKFPIAYESAWTEPVDGK